MEGSHALLFEVWQEACRHIEIEEFVSRIAPILRRRLPADVVLVRRIDPERHSLETVAVAGDVQRPERIRDELSPEAFEEVLSWCGRRTITRGEAGRKAPARFLPAGVDGGYLAGPLVADGASAGILVLATVRRKIFAREHEALAQVLLDPFSVALENDHRLREMETLREAAEADKLSALTRLGRQSLNDAIVGAELGLRGVMQRVDLVARSDVSVLLLGETGSGKEVVARAIHDRSARATGPFLRVNCGAISPELIDSELFGHEPGSFTGALALRKGWFERADGGTLLLDEIGELPLPAQVRLLRILQDGSFERMGGERQLHVDVRIVAATHRDLEAMVRDGRFREDLWYRIAVFPIRIPPLRERTDDIAALASHFALRASRRFGTRPLAPSLEDLRLLAAYSWPGNVRELQTVIDRAAILGDGRCLEVAKALGGVSSPRVTGFDGDPPSPGAESAFATLDRAMADHIEEALRRTRGRIEGAAGAAWLLGINPHTLRARMRKLGVEWSRFRL